jgi:hypothetical protein
MAGIPQTPQTEAEIDEARHYSLLVWLTEQTLEQQKSLRDVDEKLFSWAATLFVTSFGALAGLSGFTTKTWGTTWRMLLVAGIVVLVGGLVTLAWQIRGKLARKQADLQRIMGQIAELKHLPLPISQDDLDGGLYFALRWGIIVAFGVIAVVLTWLTFS